MQNCFLAILLILFVSLASASAQTSPEREQKLVSGGILNGKATNLVKPSYPKEAKAAGADGAVLIEVVVDEKGNVISAKAVNGHPLLQAVSVEAARASKFAPTTIAGQRSQVRGVVLYNFVIPMSFIQIGYELALAEKSSTPERFPLASLASSLPSDWKTEKDAVYKLEFPTRENVKETKPKSENTTQDSTTKKPSENEGRFYDVGPLRAVSTTRTKNGIELSKNNLAAVEILKNIQTDIRSRLSSDETRLWLFSVGRILGSLQAELDNTEKTRSYLNDLKNFAENPPSNVLKDFVRRIETIAEFSKYDTLTQERRNQLFMLVKELRHYRR